MRSIRNKIAAETDTVIKVIILVGILVAAAFALMKMFGVLQLDLLIFYSFVFYEVEKY